MNRDLLLAHFDRISEAPDAIPHLRQFILDLAVRGSIVPQDPNEGPGSDLLVRIQAEERRRQKDERLRQRRRLPRLTTDEIPFESPDGWKWLRVAELGITQTGTTPSSNNPEYFGDYIPFLKPADLTGKEPNYAGEGLSKQGIAHSRLIPSNSVLMVCIGSSIGKVNVTDRDACCNQQISTVTPYLAQLSRFASFSLKASYFQKLVRARAGMGTLPIISKGKWEILPIPLPPFAEQQRIVAKVDELMSLCDQLEVMQEQRDNLRYRLAAASHHRLNTGSDALSIRKSAIFYINHFGAVSAQREQINQHRQTIRSLAIRGYLVPQDANEQPASELLREIMEDRARLVKEGKTKKLSNLLPIAQSDAPFDLPAGWIWTRLGELASLVTSGSRDWAKYYSREGAIFVRMGNLSRDSYQLRLTARGASLDS